MCGEALDGDRQARVQYVDVVQRIIVSEADGPCCLRAPELLGPEVRRLRQHLLASRDLLEALADPARQDLVPLLARGELNVGEIAAHVTLSRPTVSHHLLVLKRAGLVRTRKQGREVFYRLNNATVRGALQRLADSLDGG